MPATQQELDSGSVTEIKLDSLGLYENHLGGYSVPERHVEQRLCGRGSIEEDR